MTVRQLRGASFRTLAVLLLLGAVLTPVLAQDAEETLDEQALPQAHFVGEAGYAYQGEADIDGGGNVSVNRFDIGAIGRIDLPADLRWDNTLFFSANDYDFGGTGLSSGEPWGTILTLRMVTRLRYAINDQWGVWAGGVFMFAPETGANWGDSFTGGGLVGFDFQQSKTLFVSIGIAVLSQIEDDARVTPSVGVNWLPDPHWAVRVGAVPATGGAAAAGEVAYRIIDPLEIGLGLLFNQRRFRLDDSGLVRDGVGEDNNLPLRLRLGWDITPDISLNLLAGVALAGELRVDDRNGNTLSESDYDPAPYVGLRFVGGL